MEFCSKCGKEIKSMEKKNPLLEEIEKECKQGDSFFNLASNSIDVYLAVSFAISFTFFIQSYFLKNGEKIIETGFVNHFIIIGLIMSVFFLFLIIFQVHYWKKKTDNSKKRQISLAKQYVSSN